MSSLLPVQQDVYKNRNVRKDSYYGRCLKKDLVSKVHPYLKDQGYYFSYEGVYKRIAISVGVDTPWHHVKHLRTKKCNFDHGVKFNALHYIPPRCLECWKVVVGPRNLKELFLLLDVQKSLNYPSKCGIELRYYTPRLYGGYFYNNSFDEGRNKYEIVRKAVDEHIGKDVNVILKRACTEFEMALGPSVGWAITDEHLEIDARLEQMVDTYTPSLTGQTSECYAQVHTSWIEWAWKFKDPTVQEFIGDLPLYPPPVTYHEGNPAEIKADIIRARANVKHDIEPDVIDAIHASLRGFEMTKRITMDKIGTVIGFEGINPLFVGEGTYE